MLFYESMYFKLFSCYMVSRIPNQMKRNGYIDFIFTARSSILFISGWLSIKCPYSIERPGSDSRKSLLKVLDDLRFAKMNTLPQHIYNPITAMGPGFRECLPLSFR